MLKIKKKNSDIYLLLIVMYNCPNSIPQILFKKKIDIILAYP